MKEKYNHMIRKYIKLREEIDRVCTSLHKLHNEYTCCSLGCDGCCMNFRLLPLEYYSILNFIKELNLIIQNEIENEKCPFLINHSCSIYPFRPIICRSHGLPIINMDREGENWELSFCQLNFKENDTEYFDHSNCYDQDTFNSKLFLLNLEFIKKFKDFDYKCDDLIDIQKLMAYI
jgi:uncharacterized protein